MLQEKTSNSVIRTMVMYSAGMLTMPIFSYFFSKGFIFEAMFKMDSSDSGFYGAIVAIVTVHVILVLFVYSAWKEGSRPTGKMD